MSTARNEGNKSGDNNADDQPTGTKLYIQMLERGGDELTSDMNKGLNLFLCFIALCILYGLYFLFGWGWLAAMWTFGDDLNWVFLGLMLSVGGGMGMGVAYSMKSQQIGWWEPRSPTDARRDRDNRGKCCGFQIY
mmetsp:Transcript_6495/g.10692  ORF Transcript_6495/g.10692 Transcript_6495/m.10692 type:complete len:135 (+) Transcript_6495:85-489(+)